MSCSRSRYMWKGGMSMMDRWLLYLIVLSLFFSIETRLAFFSFFHGLDDVLPNKMIIFYSLSFVSHLTSSY